MHLDSEKQQSANSHKTRLCARTMLDIVFKPQTRCRPRNNAASRDGASAQRCHNMQKCNIETQCRKQQCDLMADATSRKQSTEHLNSFKTSTHNHNRKHNNHTINGRRLGVKTEGSPTGNPSPAPSTRTARTTRQINGAKSFSG